MFNKKLRFDKFSVFLVLSVLLNSVFIYREVLLHRQIPPSLKSLELQVVEKSREQGTVFRDENDVLYVTGKLTSEVGAQVLESIKEGLIKIELDLVGGELSQAIRISELLRSYRYPLSVKTCKGSCLAIWLPSSSDEQNLSWRQQQSGDSEMTDSEWTLLKGYLISRGVEVLE